MIGLERDGSYLSNKLALKARGDLGGFNISDSSDFSSDIIASLGYGFTGNVALLLGYRYMYVDYSDGRGTDLFAMDVDMHGPIVGLEISF